MDTLCGSSLFVKILEACGCSNEAAWRLLSALRGPDDGAPNPEDDRLLKEVTTSVFRWFLDLGHVGGLIVYSFDQAKQAWEDADEDERARARLRWQVDEHFHSHIFRAAEVLCNCTSSAVFGAERAEAVAEWREWMLAVLEEKPKAAVPNKA